MDYSKLNFKFKEQKPMVADGSIYVEVRMESAGGEYIIANEMYFICDADKKITSYFEWQKRASKPFEEAGYKFNL
jgi:hypothetical protein